MKHLIVRRLAYLLSLLAVSVGFAQSADIFQSGDRVAFVGAGLVERARLNGHIETAMQLGVGNEVTGLTFRNLGWSGDSVFGDARSYFGQPKEGRERLQNNITEWQPQVLFLNYGSGAAMSVEQGWTNERSVSDSTASGEEKSLAAFREGYQLLLDDLKAAAPESIREMVLVSPAPLENLGEPLPDQTENNQRIGRFRDVIRELAKSNEVRFLDLFALMGGDDFSGEAATQPLTTDGVHFSDLGYQRVAAALVSGLGYILPEVVNIEALVQLRETIIEKNRLFFHRWRPANETYLFLFRKHEQGNNAVEIPQFDPIIAEREKEIEALRQQALNIIKG